MMRPTFQISGIVSVCNETLISSVASPIAIGPRCFNMMGAIPSGPSALDVLEDFIASVMSSVV